MRGWLRWASYLTGLTLVGGVYLFLLFAGPSPIQQIPETRRQLAELEAQNRILQQKINRKKECLQALESNADMQDRAIRSKLELQKEGEKTILLPEEQKKGTSPCEGN